LLKYPGLAAVNHFPQPKGILGRSAGLIIVEKAINFFALIMPGKNCPGPPDQGLRIIPALVSLSRPMQPDIDKTGRRLFGRKAAGQIINAEGRISFAQDFINAIIEPTRIAKFEGIAEFVGQGL